MSRAPPNTDPAQQIRAGNAIRQSRSIFDSGSGHAAAAAAAGIAMDFAPLQRSAARSIVVVQAFISVR